MYMYFLVIIAPLCPCVRNRRPLTGFWIEGLGVVAPFFEEIQSSTENNTIY